MRAASWKKTLLSIGLSLGLLSLLGAGFRYRRELQLEWWRRKASQDCLQPGFDRTAPTPAWRELLKAGEMGFSHLSRLLRDPEYASPPAHRAVFPHSSTSSDTAWRGSLKRRVDLPFSTRRVAGGPRVSSRPEASSRAYSSGVGFCGEPSRFQALKALLCSSSMRKCSNRASPSWSGRPPT